MSVILVHRIIIYFIIYRTIHNDISQQAYHTLVNDSEGRLESRFSRSGENSTVVAD